MWDIDRFLSSNICYILIQADQVSFIFKTSSIQKAMDVESFVTWKV